MARQMDLDNEAEQATLCQAVRQHLSTFLELTTKDRGMAVYGMLKDNYV